MTHLHTFRHLALGLLIGFALLLPCCPAHAADRETLTVAGGCFWCVEADFESVPGVSHVVSGYTGGTLANPTYKQVTKGGTGHFEAVQIAFDPNMVTRAELLHLFFRSIDPTDAGGQFCDRGDSYRAAIFVSTEAERQLANGALAAAQADLKAKIITPILDIAPFYEAESYHQDFYKSSALILTRFGPRKKSTAYKLYRNSCGRDAKIVSLWGPTAPFVGS